MKTFRVHCWLDVVGADEEIAKLIAQVQLTLLVKNADFIKGAGVPGIAKEISGTNPAARNTR